MIYTIDSSKVIDIFMRRWTDDLPRIGARTRLIIPLLSHAANATPGLAADLKRGYMCIDWSVRVCAAAWLELAGLTWHAESLRAMGAIVDETSAEASLDTSAAAGKAAMELAETHGVSRVSWMEEEVFEWGDVGLAFAAGAGAAASDVWEWVATESFGVASLTANQWSMLVRVARAVRPGTDLGPTVATLQTSASQLVVRMCSITGSAPN
jgi:hypothetical protein